MSKIFSQVKSLLKGTERSTNLKLVLYLSQIILWNAQVFFFFSETFPLTLKQIFLKDDSFETRATNIASIVLLAFAKVDSTDRTSGLSDFFFFFLMLSSFSSPFSCWDGVSVLCCRVYSSMDAFPSPTLTIRAWVRLQKYAGPRSQSHWPSTKRGSSTSSPWERTVTCGNVWLLMSMYRSRMCRASTSSLEACSRSSRGTCNWISQSCY